MPEKKLTEQESLQLITGMINKAKNDFHESGASALLWGSVIMLCSIVSLINLSLKWKPLEYIWLLTLAAIVPQIIISVKEAKKRRYKTYDDDAMGGIWTSFAIAIFILSFYSGTYQIPHSYILYFTLYGMPTFATGVTHRFKPMIVGGLICWAFAIASFFIDSVSVELILFALAGFFAWLLPGIILRRKYLAIKRQYV